MDTKTNEQDILQKGSQWLRVGVLTVTTLGPVVNALLDRMRQNSEQVNTQAVQEKMKSTQAATLQRLEEITVVSRKQAAEQAEVLRTQAQQLQQQAQQLRKALREETKQRAKLAKQLRKTGIDWSQDMLKRGEHLSDGLVEQSAKLSHDLKERGEQITDDLRERADTVAQELTKRTSSITHDLTERGGQVTEELAKRGGQITHDLTERGGELVQKRGRLLAIIGFSIAFTTAAVATFLLVRRMVQQKDEQDQQIELPHNGAVNGNTNGIMPRGQAQEQPTGEIVILSTDGTIVTIAEPDTEGDE